jgi:hypothetical protein
LTILVIGPDVPCVSVELKLKMPVQIWSHAFQVIMQLIYLLIPLKRSIICFLSPDFAITVSTLVIDPDILFISKIEEKMLLQIWSYAFQVRFGVLVVTDISIVINTIRLISFDARVSNTYDTSSRVVILTPEVTIVFLSTSLLLLSVSLLLLSV